MAEGLSARGRVPGTIRVAHLTTAHDHRDVRIFEKECATLVAAGYEVWGLAPGAPDAMQDGVRLRPIPKIASGFLPLRYWRRLQVTYQCAAELGADIYHLHDPELIPIGVLLKRRGARFIYDAHEDAPVEARSLNRARPVKGRLLSIVWRALIALAKWCCDDLVAATPDVAATLAPRPAAVVHNFPRLEKFPRIGSENQVARDPSRLIYVGSLSEIRGLLQMLDALEIVSRRMPCRLRLAGRFASDALRVQAEAHPAWRLVDYLGQIPWPRVIEELQYAAVGLLLLHPTPEYVVSVPTKLFEYMAAGIPVICSDFPFLRRVVKMANCGTLVNPLESVAIADAVATLLADPVAAAEQGQRGRLAMDGTYSWEAQAAILLSVYDRLAASLPTDTRDKGAFT